MSEQIEIKLADLSVLSLRHGDRLVLRLQSRLSEAAYYRLKSVFSELVPDHKVLILEEGAELAVLRDDTAEGTE